tara:strand:+ start:6 stop:1820 length:1815 start_codon:yes stop_codon:yes gene_type:complete
MKLDCVLTASNENKLYLDFIPIFIKTWNKLYPDVDVKIILVAKNIPDNLLCHKENIILFKPIENILTSFTAQFIRLLYPCLLNYENGVLITDMDMLPMNRTYYTESIKSYGSDKFIYYRGNVCSKNNEIAMCYNVATPRIWNDIFRISTIEDIKEKLKFIFNDTKGRKSMWSIDQKFLYDKVIKWNKKTNNFIRNKEDNFKRLNRKRFDINDQKIRKNITDGKYSDYHCYRPMSKYSEINYEIYNLLPYSMNVSLKKDLAQNSILFRYKKLKFENSELKSPIGGGLFNIFLNKNNNIVYKKIKKSIKDIKNYKNIIYNLKNDKILGKFIFELEKTYIEDDGSYYSSYIKNGVRLYDINLKYNTDKATLENLKKSILDMKRNLNDYVQKKTLSGDWGLHNLIYCLDTNIIYNVDLEGFYTYPFKINNGNCKIRNCNDRFDKLLDTINKLISKKNDINNNNYFTLILWNPTLFQSDKILKEIPNIIEKKYIEIPKDKLHDYIFDIYKYDLRCSHNRVLPPKIKKLKEYDTKHLIVKFKIDNPYFTRSNICRQAIKLKENIRRKYKSNIKNYVKDIMMHVADDFNQSKFIWEYDSNPKICIKNIMTH